MKENKKIIKLNLAQCHQVHNWLSQDFGANKTDF